MFNVYLKLSDRYFLKTYIGFHMNGNNELLVPQQRRSLFISVYDHLQTSENTMIVTTASEREVTARCHRT